MPKEAKRSFQLVRQIKKSKYVIGVHLIVEFFGGKIIEESKEIKKILIEAVRKSKNIPLKILLYKFFPQGITGIILLAESHIFISTWPEIKYTAIDIFTCGKKSQPEKALEYLKEKFQPKKVKIRKIKRGIF